MAQVIKLKRSSVLGKTPQTSSLELGELAINTRDGKIYFHRSGSGDDSIQSVFTTDATITGSLKLSGSQHISGSTNIMDNLTYGGDLSASLGSTSSFDRIISAGTSSVGYLIASGSNIVTTPDLTGSFASGSDVQGILDTYASGSDFHQFFAESSSYIVESETGSFASGSDVQGILDTYASGSDVQGILDTYASGSDVQTILDDYAKGTEISGSYLGLLSGSNDLTLGGGISGSIVSTASFGAYVGDGSQLTGINAAVNTYTNSGNNRIITSVDSTSINAEQNLTFDGTLLSGSATTTASFGKFVGDGSGLSGVQIETGSFASGSDVQTILDTYASGSDVQGILDTYASGSDLQVILAESASYVVSTNTGSFASGSDLQVILAESASYLTNNTTSSFGAVTMNETLFVQGDITTSGSVIAREFKTEFVSSSIIYSSGSSQFGDTIDDIHRFTGSLELTGSIQIDGDESAIDLTTNGVRRFQITKNIADDFKINRFDGGGSFLDQPLSIASSSGITTIKDQLTRSGGVTFLRGGGSTTDGVGVYNDMKVGIGTGTTAIGDEKLKVDGDVGITGSLFVSSSITTPTTASLGKIILSDNVHTTPFASGSDVQTIKDTYASGSDVSGLLSATGSYASGSDVQGILDTYASGSDVQTILDDYAKRTEISGSFNQGFEFTGTISGSITSTGSFGKLLGDASELSNLPESFTSAMISGSFQGGGSTLISGSITSTGSFGSLVVNGNVNVPDSAILNLGAGNDLQLFHNGTNSFVSNYGGTLYIENNVLDSDIYFRVNDGGVTTTALQIDASEGNVRIPDSVEFNLGSGQDLRILHDGSNSQIKNYTGTLYISSLGTNGDIIFQVDQGGVDQRIMVLDGSRDAVAIGRRADAGTLDPGDDKLLVAGDVGVTGSLFVSSSITTENSIITSEILNNTGTLRVSQSVSDGDIEISVNDGGVTTRAVTIDGSDAGSVILGNNLRLQDNQKIRLGTSNDFNLYHDGSNSYLYNETTGGKIIIQNNAFDSDIEIKVSDSGSLVNAIIIDASEVGQVKLPNDSQKLTIGASGDLSLHHTSDNSYIVNTTTGDLYIQNSVDDKDIIFRTDDGAGGVTPYLTLDGSITKTIASVDVSASLGTTGSFDRLEGVTLNASISPFASGSDVSGLLSATGSYASGSDVSQILIESASYLVDADTGSLGLLTLGNNITGSITSTGSFGRIDAAGTIKSTGQILLGDENHFLVGQIKVSDGTRDIRLNANHSSNAVVGTVGSHDFNIMTANTFRMTIDSSGNVGIGSTAPNDDKLLVAGNAGITGDLYVSGSITAEEYIVKSSVINVTQSFSSGSTIFGDSLDDTHKFTGSLGVTGSIAVGKPDASYNLDVNRSTAGVIAQFQFGDDTDGRIQIYADANAGSVGNDTGLSGETIYFQDDLGLRFITNSSEKMRLTTGGVLSIGATSFGTADNLKLLVAGDTGITGSLTVSGSITTNPLQTNSSASFAYLELTGSIGELSRVQLANNGGVYSKLVGNERSSAQLIRYDTGNQTLVGANTELTLAGGTIVNDFGNAVDFRVETNANTHAIFLDDSADALGIFTANPTSELTVEGDISASGDFIGSSTSTGSFGALAIGHGTPDQPLRVYAQAADSDVARFSHGSANSAVDIYTGTSGGLINVRNGSGTSTINIDARNDRINLADTIKTTYGTGNDLEIYHDGTNSVINHAGTGDLQIYQNQDDQDIVLLCDDGAGGTTDYIRLDGSSTSTKVYKNLEFSDNVRARFGASDDLQIYHNATNSYITNGTGDLIVSQSAQDKNFAISINDGGTTKTAFFIDGATGYVGIGETSLVKQFQVNGTITITNNGGYTQRDNVGNIATILNLNSSNLLTVGDNNHADNIKIQNSSFNHIYFNSVGDIGIGTSSPSERLHVYDTGSNLQFYLQSGADQATIRFDNNTATYVVGINSAEQYQWYSSALGQNAGFISSNGNLYWNYTFLLSNNNKFIQGRDTAGQTRNMLGMNSANNIQLGDSNHTGSMVVNTPLLTGSLASTASFGAFIGDGSQLTGITASPDATLVSGSFEGGGSTNISGSLASTGSFGQLIVQKEGSSGMSYGSYNFRNTAIFEGSNASGATIAISAKNTGYSGIFFGDQDSSTQGQIQFDHTTNTFKFVEGGVVMMEIDTSGNASLPQGNLNVTGSINVSGSVLPVGDNSGVQDIGSSSKRWNDVFAVQTTVGAVFETGLRSEGIGKEETGTIVVWRNGGLVPCDKSEDTMVMGVVKQGKDEPIVMGAEPVLVTGDVKEGDFITTSTKLGHGKKIESGYLLRKEMFGKVIAQALENATGESSLIKCMIRKM